MLAQCEKQSLLETANRHHIDGFLVYSAGLHWWSRLFNPLGHVSLIVRKGKNHIWVEPLTSFSDLVYLPEGAQWRGCFDDRAVVQQFRFWRETKGYRCPHLLQPFTCVEQVKAFLGIRRWWVFTPKQLWRYIDGQSVQAEKAKG